MSLEPEGRQLELLAAVVNASRLGAKVVAVLVHGRPMSFEGQGGSGGVGVGEAPGLRGVGAVLATWRSGEEGGSAGERPGEFTSPDVEFTSPAVECTSSAGEFASSAVEITSSTVEFTSSAVEFASPAVEFAKTLKP